jgi:membrane protein implicated in regulation of membrane protease activity
MKDRRVRKALFSLIGVAILTLAFTVFALSQIHPQLMTVGILSAVTILSAVRFFQTKKKVRQEFITKASQKERL